MENSFIDDIKILKETNHGNIAILAFISYCDVNLLDLSLIHPCVIYSSALPVVMVHIDLCVIEYSLGDAPTALKHGDEACLHIWHLK